MQGMGLEKLQMQGQEMRERLELQRLGLGSLQMQGQEMRERLELQGLGLGPLQMQGQEMRERLELQGLGLGQLQVQRQTLNRDGKCRGKIVKAVRRIPFTWSSSRSGAFYTISFFVHANVIWTRWDVLRS